MKKEKIRQQEENVHDEKLALYVFDCAKRFFDENPEKESYRHEYYETENNINNIPFFREVIREKVKAENFSLDKVFFVYDAVAFTRRGIPDYMSSDEDC